MDCVGGRPKTHAGRPAIEAKDAEPREVRHARCMAEILASLLINVLLRKGFEKVETHHTMSWFMVQGRRPNGPRGRHALRNPGRREVHREDLEVHRRSLQGRRRMAQVSEIVRCDLQGARGRPWKLGRRSVANRSSHRKSKTDRKSTRLN